MACLTLNLFLTCKQYLRLFPSARGVIFDLPGVAEGQEEELTEEGKRRVERVAGSFLGEEGDMDEALKGRCDVVLLKFILHDWDDQVRPELC